MVVVDGQGWLDFHDTKIAACEILLIASTSAGVFALAGEMALITVY